MAKGKKTPPETIYKVMADWSVTSSFTQTAKNLDIPLTTVKKIVDTNKNKDEFVKLCTETQSDFAEKATRIINKALARMERMIDDEDTFIPLNHLSTMSGTLYDKRALAKGESTANERVQIEVKYE